MIVDGRECETAFKVELPLPQQEPEMFGWSGVLLRDKNTDEVQCHICGKWFHFLGMHIVSKHVISCDYYRAKYGLKNKQALCSRAYSTARRELAEKQGHLKPSNGKLPRAPGRKYGMSHRLNNLTDQHLNINGMCDLQLQRRYLIISEQLGKPPTYQDLKKIDTSLLNAIVKRFEGLKKFRAKFGFDSPMSSKVTDENLLYQLREMARLKGRVPVKADFTLPGFHAASTFYTHFGSWRRALAMAGLI